MALLLTKPPHVLQANSHRCEEHNRVPLSHEREGVVSLRPTVEFYRLVPDIVGLVFDSNLSTDKVPESYYEADTLYIYT